MASIVANAPTFLGRRNSLRHDEAFLSLLSSQRELLHQLNLENALRREQEQLRAVATNMNTTINTRLGNNISNSQLNIVPTSNEYNYNRRSSLDCMFAQARRQPFNYAYDNIVLPDVSFENERIDLGYEENFLMMDAKLQNEFLDDEMLFPPSKKRRMSNFGLTTTFFEDYLKPTSRRNSMFSVVDPYDSDDLHSQCGKDDTSVNSGACEVSVDQDESTANNSTNAKILEKNQASAFLPCDKKVDPVDVKKVMQSFTTAMERSQKTQQDIHDWDRKMGLKRSHSKTMRLSSRSRKKLRAMLKKDINSMLSKHSSM